MSAQKRKKRSKAEQDHRTNIINTVMVLLFAAAALALLVWSRGWYRPLVTALSADGYDMDAVTFNYFYRDCYDSFQSAYGEMLEAQGSLQSGVSLAAQDYAEDYSWAQFFYDTAVQNAKRSVTVYLAALQAGYELPAEAVDEIDAQLDTIDANARANGYSTGAGFLRGHYGPGSSMKSYREYLLLKAVSDGWSGAKYSGASYTDEELAAWFSENYPEAGDAYDYGTVDFRMIYLPYTGYTLDPETGTAGYSEETTADVGSRLQYIASLYGQSSQTEESFSALAEEYSSYNRAEGGLYENALKDDDGVEAQVRLWLFAEGRAAGDTELIAADSGGYLVYWSGEDMPAWEFLAQKGLRTEAWNEWFTALAETMEFTENPHILRHLYLTA